MNNSTQNNHELLVRYLDHDMNEMEREELERRLEGDPSLMAELEELKIAREAVRQYGLRRNIAILHGEMMQEMRPQGRKIAPARRILRYSMSVAAGILLLVGAFMAYNFFTLSPEKIFTRRYQPFELSTVRSTSDDAPVVKAYRADDYKEVIRIHTQREDSSLHATFLAGMSNLELNNMNDAIPDLEEVVNANKNSPQPVYRDEAEYYLALSYIRNRDYDLAIPILEKIRTEPDHLYYAKVDRRLLRNVKMLKWR